MEEGTLRRKSGSTSMNSGLLEQVILDFCIHPTLYNWLQYFSILTWHKIAFARNMKFRTLETTYTENLLFAWHQLAGFWRSHVFIYEAKDEKSNGNDLEIVLQTPRGHLLFPTQAKILSPNNKYPGMAHRKGASYQIDYLLDYAKLRGGIPLYLLYNSCTNLKMLRLAMAASKEDLQLFGCSLVSAQIVKDTFYNNRWKIPSFSDIHPQLAIPFYYLQSPNFAELHHFATYFQESGQLKFYTAAEIFDDKNWTNLRPPVTLGRIHKKDKQLEQPFTNTAQQNSFNPRFRIIMSTEGPRLIIRRNIR